MSHPDPKHDPENVYPHDDYSPTKKSMAKKMKPEVIAFVKSNGRHSEKEARKMLRAKTWNRKERGNVARTARESWSEKIK